VAPRGDLTAGVSTWADVCPGEAAPKPERHSQAGFQRWMKLIPLPDPIRGGCSLDRLEAGRPHHRITRSSSAGRFISGPVARCSRITSQARARQAALQVEGGAGSW